LGLIKTLSPTTIRLSKSLGSKESDIVFVFMYTKIVVCRQLASFYPKIVDSIVFKV